MMRRGIFENLQAPWFFAHADIKYAGYGQLASEDVILCHHILKVPIMLDTRIHVGHEKLTVLR